MLPSPRLSFLLAFLVLKRLRCQELALSFPSPASLDALAEHLLDEYEQRGRTSAVPYAPSFLRLGDAIADGSPSVAFDSTSLTGAVHPPHAEPPLVIDYNGEAR